MATRPAVAEAALAVSKCRTVEVPLALLSLKELDLESTGELAWKSELLHRMTEALRQDFTQVDGQWRTAGQLASLLARLCSVTRPVIQDDAATQDGQMAGEYYHLLLPAVVDSLLMLANTLLERATAAGVPEDSCYISSFVEVNSSLDCLCKAHNSCAARVLQSPFLLRAVMCDHASLCVAELSLIGKLIRAGSEITALVPTDVLEVIVDEVVYKISDPRESVAMAALHLLDCIAQHSQLLISQRLLLSVFNLSRCKKLSPQVLNLIEGVDVFNYAALRIQATWKGYLCRKKLRKANSGIRKLQLVYRRNKLYHRKDLQLKKQQKIQSRRHMQQNLRVFHEKQMAVLEQLPSAEVNRFEQQLEDKAAVQLQTWWRGRLAWRRLQQVRDEAKAPHSVEPSVKDLSAQPLTTTHTVIAQSERDLLQSEILRHRERHPFTHKSSSHSQRLHNQVQASLQDLHTRARLADPTVHALLKTQVEEDCKLLLHLPPLQQATEQHTSLFTSGSREVGKMALLAHQAELRDLALPWWKKLATPNDSDVFL